MSATSRLRFAALVLASLVLLIAILIAIAHTPPVKRYALERLQQYLDSAHDIDFRADRIDYNLLRFSLTLEGVRVQAAAAPDLPPLATADRVSVDVGLLSLIRGFLSVRDLQIDNLAVQIVIAAEERDNFPRSIQEEVQEDAASGLPEFLVNSLVIHRGSFLMRDDPQGIIINLPAWRLEVQGRRPSLDHEVHFQTQRAGRAEYQGEPVPVESLVLRATLPASLERVDIDELHLVSERAEVQAAGGVEQLYAPLLDLEVAAAVDLGTVSRMAELPQRLEGTLTFEGRVVGPPAEIRIDGNLEGNGLSVGDFRMIDLLAGMVLDARENRLSFDFLSLRSPLAALEAEVSLALGEAAGQSAADVRVDFLNLLALTRTLGIDTQIASRGTGTLNFRWQGLEFTTAQGNADFALRATRSRPAPDTLPLTANLVLEAGQDTLRVVADPLRAAGGVLQARLAVHQFRRLFEEREARLDGMFSLRTADIGTVVADLDRFLGRPPSDSLFGPDLQGPITATATLAGTTGMPIVNLQAAGPSLQVGDLHGIDLNVSARYQADEIALHQITLEWQKHLLTAQGRIRDVTQEHPSFDMAVRAERGRVETVLAALESDLPVSGEFGFEATLRGTTEDPQARLDLQATNLQAFAEPFGTLNLEAQVAGDRVDLVQLRLDKQSADEEDLGFLAASGHYRLDTQEYVFTAEGADFTLLNLVLPGEVPVRGTLGLAAGGRGTIQDPSLELQVEAEEMLVSGQELGAFSVSSRLAGQTAEATVQAHQFNLRAQGAVGIVAPYPARLELTAQETNLALIPLPTEGRLDGRLSAVLQGRGELEDWPEVEASVRVSQMELLAEDEVIRNDGPVDIDFEERNLRIPAAAFVGWNSRVTLEGNLPLDETAPPGRLEVRGEFDLATLSQLVPLEEEFQATGRLFFDSALEGSFEQLDPTASITLGAAQVNAPTFVSAPTTLDLDLRLDEGTLFLDRLLARSEAGVVEAEGVIPLGMIPAELPLGIVPAEGPATFDLSLQGLRLETLAPLPEEMAGLISLRVQAEAPRAEMEAITGEIVFEELVLQLAGFEFGQAEDTVAELRDGSLYLGEMRLRGPETEISASGTANLWDDQAVDFAVQADLNIEILSAFVDDLDAAGAASLEFTLAGSLSEPEFGGFLELTGGQVAFSSPPLAATALEITAEVVDNQLIFREFQGLLNDGSLNLTGQIGLDAPLENVSVSIVTSDVFMNFPEGLQTLHNAEVRVESAGEFLDVRGQVQVAEGLYSQPVNLEELFLNLISAGRTVEVEAEPDLALARIRYDIAIDTVSPIYLNNNLAQVLLDTDIRLVGTYYRPALTGRVVMEEGGELYLRERTYLIERGVITFVDETTIDPSFDIVAQTEVAGYTISLQILGETEDLETTLTSDPPLPEPDIIAVLLTGRTLQDIRGQEALIAREQTLSLLAGTFVGRVETGLEAITGLSRVRIEPNLISPDANPGARLTIGQELLRGLEFIYSVNLADSSDQIYIAEYYLTRRLLTRALHQTQPETRGFDQRAGYRFELRHDVQFGGEPAVSALPTARDRPQIRAVTFSGEPGYPAEEIRSRFRVEAGQRHDFFQVRRELDRLIAFYHSRGHLEVSTRLRRDEAGPGIAIDLEIQAGPVVELSYSGMRIPRGVRREVRETWSEGFYDLQRRESAIRALRSYLLGRNYLEGEVTVELSEPAADRKQVTFHVEPGVRYQEVVITFPGAQGISEDELRSQLEDAGLLTAVHARPDDVSDFVARLYRHRGYLDAEVEAPGTRFDREARSAAISVPISEGPLYRVREVRFHGNRALTSQQLEGTVPLLPGEPANPQLRLDSVLAIEDLYARLGYHDTVVRYSIDRAHDLAVVDLDFQIEENRQRLVEGVRVAGTDHTTDRFVVRQLEFEPGAVLDIQSLGKSRRHLYQTGAFSLVEIQSNPVEPSIPRPDYQQPVELLVRVQEVRPFQLRYGGSFDTERGPGVIADFTTRNVLGRARVAGLRTRFDGETRELRGFFSQPLTRTFPINTVTSLFGLRDINREAGFTTDRFGLTAHQEIHLDDMYILSYGYRFERVHLVPNVADAEIVARRENTGPLTGALTRDTRDDILDATRGTFLSQVIEYTPGFLGSDVRFARYFGQYFRYIALRRPQRAAFRNGVTKPRLVYAGGVRLGLAHALEGQELLPSERFFAGGENTIRGFQEDSVGPLTALGRPTGGEAVFLFNHELRFPLISIFDGVSFLDMGNVYRDVSDFNPFDLRYAAGLGLRIRTPYILLRADYGVKLDRREGERRGAFFFSIGQAF
jgi:outer membrane protein assembly complex protein YaeT